MSTLLERMISHDHDIQAKACPTHVTSVLFPIHTTPNYAHARMLTNTNTPLPSHAMITPQLRSRETGTTRPRATRRMCTAMLHAVESRHWTSMGVQRPNARTEIWLDVLNLDPGLCRPQGQVRRQSACSERAPQSASWTELPVAAATLWSTSHCMNAWLATMSMVALVLSITHI